jgi:hypothetical protein
MPDIAIVFGNGTVRGEPAGLGDVDKTLLTPFISVKIPGFNLSATEKIAIHIL